MAEEIRCYVMRKMSQNKMKLDGRAGPLCPWQQSRLEKEKIEATTGHPCGVVIMQGKGIILKTTAKSRIKLISVMKI